MIANWTNLTPEEAHITFGYYDRFAWDEALSFHLAIKIPQQERVPLPGEEAEVGIIERSTRKFKRLTTTSAWNHQQGAMTLWLPHRPGSFIFNDMDTIAGRPISRVFDLSSGLVEEHERPIYCLSNDGRWGISLNFSRIPRRGYSYAGTPLPDNEPMPNLDFDGLFLVDMHTGATSLMASYRQLIDAHPFKWDIADQHVWLNHAIFNESGDRVMVLLRHMNLETETRWKTQLLTMDTDGGRIQCALSSNQWRGISHQIWGRSSREILVDADWCGRGSEYVVYDESNWPLRATRISRGTGLPGHLKLSPDGGWLAADTYAHDNEQQLVLVRMADGECRRIGRFKHHIGRERLDVRCDLHPRWSRDGSLLTIDTIHEGSRSVYLMETEEIIARFGDLELVSRM